MTNSIGNILEKIGDVLAWPFVHLARAAAILKTALAEFPALRTAVLGLMTQIDTLITDIGVAASQEVINIASDAAEVQAAIALWNYVKLTFLPAIKAAINGEVQAATGQADAAAAAAATRSAAATKAAATRAAAAKTSTTTAATVAANTAANAATADNGTNS